MDCQGVHPFRGLENTALPKEMPTSTEAAAPSRGPLLLPPPPPPRAHIHQQKHNTSRNVAANFALCTCCAPACAACQHNPNSMPDQWTVATIPGWLCAFKSGATKAPTLSSTQLSLGTSTTLQPRHCLQFPPLSAL